MTKNTESLSVWLKFESPEDEEVAYEANVDQDGNLFVASWSHTAVGVVRSRAFTTEEAAEGFLAAEGFQNFTVED